MLSSPHRPQSMGTWTPCRAQSLHTSSARSTTWATWTPSPFTSAAIALTAVACLVARLHAQSSATPSGSTVASSHVSPAWIFTAVMIAATIAVTTAGTIAAMNAATTASWPTLHGAQTRCAAKRSPTTAATSTLAVTTHVATNTSRARTPATPKPRPVTASRVHHANKTTAAPVMTAAKTAAPRVPTTPTPCQHPISGTANLAAFPMALPTHVALPVALRHHLSTQARTPSQILPPSSQDWWSALRVVPRLLFPRVVTSPQLWLRHGHPSRASLWTASNPPSARLPLATG